MLAIGGLTKSLCLGKILTIVAYGLPDVYSTISPTLGDVFWLRKIPLALATKVLFEL